MEKILTVENGEVRFLRDEFELIPEFAAILTMKYNKQVGDTEGKLRRKGKTELMYMWFMHSYASPFREYSDEERHEEACLTAQLPLDFKLTTEFQATIVKYKQLNETRILKLIRAAERAIDKLRQYFESVDFTLKDEKGALVYKPSEVIRAIIDLDKVATGLEKLAMRVQNEKKEGSATRGAQEDGWVMENNDYERTRDNSASEPDED